MKNKIVGLLCLCVVCSLSELNAAEIWVSPTGQDSCKGTMQQPKATLQAALRQARELRRLGDASVEGGIHVYLKGGVYCLTEMLQLMPEDSGSPDSPTRVEAAPGENPVLSGGLTVRGWKRVSTSVPGLSSKVASHIFVANVPLMAGRRFDFRQMWMNGEKRPVASSSDEDNMLRILGFDSEKQIIRIPAIALKKFQKPSEMELFVHQMWETMVLRVASIEVKGKEAILRFHQPEARLEFEHPWPPLVVSDKGNSPFILRRAIEFMDTPGEWFYDRSTGQLYYYPKPDEDMNQAEAVVPVLETLIRVQGTPERPVHDVIFRGLTFAYSTWMRPSFQGDVPLQAGMFLIDAYKLKVPGTPDKATLENQAWVGRPAAAVQLSDVRRTVFEDCSFIHTGAAGLDYLYGCNGDRVEGCLFRDIAGSGLVIGKFSDPGIEAHLPYDPSDSRELAQNMMIRNNLVEDVANEYWGCCGMIAGFVRGVTFEHNELCNLSYTGISVGWGWTRTVNAMRNNLIHANLVHHFARHNYSCGGLYTLSAQPGTVLSENAVRDAYSIEYAHDTTDYRIYLDEASSYIKVCDNWTDQPKFGFNQVSQIDFKNNGPQVSAEIREKAGLEHKYRQKFGTHRACEPFK